MKILKEPPSWSRVVRCGTCLAEFEIDTSDVRTSTWFDRVLGHYWTCPYCGSEMKLRDLPDYVKTIAAYRTRH